MPQIMLLSLISRIKLLNQTTFLVKPFAFITHYAFLLQKLRTHRNEMRGREPPTQGPLSSIAERSSRQVRCRVQGLLLQSC